MGLTLNHVRSLIKTVQYFLGQRRGPYRGQIWINNDFFFRFFFSTFFIEKMRRSTMRSEHVEPNKYYVSTTRAKKSSDKNHIKISRKILEFFEKFFLKKFCGN